MQKITFEKQSILSKHAQNEVIDILKKDAATDINIDFVTEPDHQMEYQTIKKMIWLNATVNWIILGLCGTIIVSLWTINLLIRMIAFLLISFGGWLFWYYKYDKKIKKLI